MKWKRGTLTVWGTIRKRAEAGWVDDSGRFGIYKSMERGGKWFLIHIGTAHPIALLRTLSGAREFAERIEHMDWNFRSPNSKKVRKNRPNAIAILEEFRRAGI